MEVARRKQLEDRAAGLIVGLKARHLETGDHAVRVARMAKLLGRELRLKEAQLDTLYYAALLHDVGKTGVADAVLSKPGRLDDDERERLHAHPMIGAAMLASLEFPEVIVRVAAEHHENWDGSGYPNKISGRAISIGARIVAVVDTFDAITCDRCYRAGAPYSVALHEIVEWGGRQFDPLVVEAFRRVPPQALLPPADGR